jgi:hypothetical protein
MIKFLMREIREVITRGVTSDVSSDSTTIKDTKFMGPINPTCVSI